MKKSYKVLITLGLIICFTALFGAELFAQCPMCRMTAESNMANGGSAGKGLNNGILYIFVMPYLLVGLIAYVWWKNKSKQVIEDTEVQDQ